IVFSNSVIEHVGTREDQRQFAREVARDGKKYWIQTPNRRFPFDHHVMLPAIHFPPKRWPHAVVSRFTGWAHLVRPTADARRNYAARESFQDAKFGMFIHWGVYSVRGKGEWVMNNDKMSIAEYSKVPPRFNPVQYDPAAWVSLAKSAGMRYITITSKHHDGFGM